MEEIYDWDVNWEWLGEKIDGLLPDDLEYEGGLEPKGLREFLNGKADWTDDDIWKALIEICDERIEQHKKQIGALEEERQQNRQKVEVFKRLGSIPSRNELASV